MYIFLVDVANKQLTTKEHASKIPGRQRVQLYHMHEIIKLRRNAKPLYYHSQLSELTQLKKKCILAFWVTGLKFLGRLGTLFFSGKNCNFMHFEKLFKMQKIIYFFQKS